MTRAIRRWTGCSPHYGRAIAFLTTIEAWFSPASKRVIPTGSMKSPKEDRRPDKNSLVALIRNPSIRGSIEYLEIRAGVEISQLARPCLATLQGTPTTPGICPVDTFAAPPDQCVAARNNDGEHQPRFPAKRQQSCNMCGHQAAHAKKKRAGVATVCATTAAGVCHAGAAHPCQHGDPYDGAPYRTQQQCEQHCNCGKSPHGSKCRPIAGPIPLLAMLSIVCHPCSPQHAAPPMPARSCWI